ncbi:hypothetical protein DWW23_08350 [Parabacteroides sp. AF14-59]|nr:hypothetical protein DWW23_08350 [Parabacteroides sp. AF14-59]
MTYKYYVFNDKHIHNNQYRQINRGSFLKIGNKFQELPVSVYSDEINPVFLLYSFGLCRNLF